jgi:branched-chain amino acid transport system permease protein
VEPLLRLRYIALGHAVFFGTSAYAVGIVAEHLHVTGGPIAATAALGAAAAGSPVPFGLVALRVRRHTFVVITIAIFFIFQLAAADLNNIPTARAG